MKRFIVLFLILAAVISFLSADYDFNFTLLLKKNGTDRVWFAESAANPNPDDSVSINIFPLIVANSVTSGKTTTTTTTTSTVSDTIYLHWLKQSSNNVTIKVTFVGNEDFVEGENKKTFMMWSAKNGEESGINFNVDVSDANNVIDAKKGLSKSFTFATTTERLTKIAESDRSFSFNPEEKDDDGEGYKYQSPLTIKMTIKPASYIYDTDGKKTGVNTEEVWGSVDEQYVGYIKATIIKS